jgi:uncharacterized Zn finger protein (UPF0148 family)
MFCPQCGAPNDEEAVFCGNCGAVLNPDAELDEMTAARHEEETREMGALPEEWAEETPEDLFESTPEPPERMVAPPPPARAYAPAASVSTSGMAIASLILGISGLTIVPFFASIAAIIIGYMARNEIRQRPDELGGDGLALAGIIMGWIAVGVTVLGLLLGGGVMLCGICGMGASGFW